MNIIFIGSNSALSILPAKAIINSGYNLCAIASDENHLEKNIENKINNIPIINADSLSLNQLALQHGIPRITIQKDFNNSFNQFKALKPDLIIVSCYARKLPNIIRSLSPLGCFNLHPSLLPEYRGPTPLFWQFRAGEKTLGVSLHEMTDEFDSGNIIQQISITKKDGISLEEANYLVSESAAKLILNSLQKIENKTYTEKVQDISTSSYQSHSTTEDYYLSTKWCAQHMYNFICANTAHGHYFPILFSDVIFYISRALAFNMEAGLEENYVIHNGVINISCSVGLIQCQLATDPL